MGRARTGRSPESGDHNYSKLKLTRLTNSRRVYTQAHTDVLAESVESVYDERMSAKGLRMAYEAEYLRFFQVRFEPSRRKQDYPDVYRLRRWVILGRVLLKIEP